MTKTDKSDRPPEDLERRDYLFDMLAELAVLAGRRGEKAIALILSALVSGYR